MTRQIIKSIATFSFMFVTAFTVQANGDTYQHIDQLANRIERKADQIVRETRHYRNTPEYAHLLTDAREMADLAEHIHDIAHHNGDLVHLQADLRKLDATFHHIEGLIDNIERQAYYGCRIVRGRTAHVKRLLNSIEDDIHHIQDDVATLLRPVRTCPNSYRTQRTVYKAPRNTGYHGNTYSNSGHSYYNNSNRNYDRGRGNTFSIGGGSSRITFRF